MRLLAIPMLVMAALPAHAQTPAETRAIIAALTAAGSHHQADVPLMKTAPEPSAPSADARGPGAGHEAPAPPPGRTAGEPAPAAKGPAPDKG